MKPVKQKRIESVKKILDEINANDVANFGLPKSRSISLWFMMINKKIHGGFRFRNNRELSALFRFFRFERDTEETSCEGCFKRIIFYKYLGEYKSKRP